MALVEQLAHLSDVVQVAGSAGAVLGAAFAAGVRTRGADGFLDQVAVGTAVGGVLGVLAGFGAYIGLEVSAVVGLGATSGRGRISRVTRNGQPQRSTLARAMRVFAVGFATSVVAGFFMGTFDAPLAAFYAFVLLLTAVGVLQILAPGAGLRSPFGKQDRRDR